MYKCPNCDYSSADTVNYCPQCGAKTVVVEPVNTAPTEQITYSEPVYTQQNQYYPAPTPVKKPHLAKKIVGMALSIEAFIVAIIVFIYTVIFVIIYGAVGFAMGLIYGILGLPPAIIGLVMSKNNIANGDTSIFSRLGKTFGIISVIIFGVGLFLGLIGLTSGHSLFGYNYYY